MARNSRPLKDYQIADGQHVAKRRSALVAHQPRVGKTNIAIHAADLVGAKLVVVVCPPNVRNNWREAILEFRKGRWTAVICGDNYAKQLVSRLGKRKIDVLVLDESHRFKNRDSGRTQAVWGEKSLGYGGLIERAARVYCLTGTPLPNDPIELWPMLRAIAPELIMSEKGRPMSYSGFMNTYCRRVNTPFGMKQAGGKNYKKLKALLMDSGFCIRRTRAEVFGRDIQPPTNIYVSAEKKFGAELAVLEASEDGRRIKAALEQGGLVGLAKVEKQAAKLRRIYGLAKVGSLASLIADELEEDPTSKIVIGFWHTDVGRAYMQALRKFHPLMFDGGATAARKIQMNKQFLHGNKHRVVCGQLNAAGVGLDFSAADNLIFAEWSFVGTDNEQFMARIFNMNSPEPKTVRFAVLPGSIDAHIAAEAARKLKVSEKIFG